jgi:hypothetical protein
MRFDMTQYHSLKVRRVQELQVITTDEKAPVLYLILQQQVLHLPILPRHFIR